MIPRRTSRRSLVAGLGLGLATGLVAAGALAPSHTRAGGHVVKDGGTLRVGALEFNFIDPALASPPDPYSPFAYTVWPAEDATCARLLRYPVGPPPLRYNLVPEVAVRYPAVSPD